MPRADALYAVPWTVASADGCHFYHSIEIPGHGLVEGQWDLRGGEDAYLGHTPVAGRRVLEIGPASGFMTFYMESRGADVVAVELAPGADWEMVPQARVDLEACRRELNEVMQQVRRSFWFAHSRFGSSARVHYSSAYDLPDELGQFDLAVMGAVCLHLRDPLRAIEACGRLAEQLVVTDRYFPELDESPVARFAATRESGGWDTWWDLSPDLLVRFLSVIGYGHTEVSLHSQRFMSADGAVLIPMFTVVGSRHAPTT